LTPNQKKKLSTTERKKERKREKKEEKKERPDPSIFGDRNSLLTFILFFFPHGTGVYLDHGGATIYAASLIHNFSLSLLTNVYGNPHSANEPARLSGDMVDEVREKTLRFFGADPEHFDLVFVANATAAIKMVADSFRDLSERTRSGTFWYGYHKDCHTSLVGVRELTHSDYECFESDEKVERWLENPTGSRIRRSNPAGLGLFAYPGQSNMNGRRLPQTWLRRVRESRRLRNTYTLFDAAALAMTCPLDPLFENPDAAPDFTCLSFYKVFGFPDLGALIVRKASGHILSLRKYFGGGTITQVTAVGRNLSHKSKGLNDGMNVFNIHDGLEDGTLPFHNILALGIGIDTHRKLYGSMQAISQHVTSLSRRLYEGMASLTHPNGWPVCRLYVDDHKDGGEAYGDSKRQGATIAFNIMRADGTYVEWTDVEKLANDVNIYVRAGGKVLPFFFFFLFFSAWVTRAIT
jgi:molybdenum cofactor sulfurtransferase